MFNEADHGDLPCQACRADRGPVKASAQLAVAREYGFASWPRLRDEVAASASRWHRLDPARAAGLLAVARMLLDAGADPNGSTGGQGGHGGWTPLRCAVAGAASPLVTRLLLKRGAVPGDHDLYLAGFADDNHECLRLLLFHAADVAQIARMALAAPISLNDAEGVHLLLEAGADPNRYADDAAPPPLRCPAGGNDDPCRPERQHRGHRADARPRLSR